jgi:23S rRNA (cytidine1920-2'-O)/16S rRNA (cytidine1409-2'-O)-methyltransferase
MLVKPQFEARRAEASRGRGVITEPAVWERTLLEVGGTFARRGAAIMGVMVSPLRGAEGNVEFLVHATSGVPADAPQELAQLAGTAVRQAVNAGAGEAGEGATERRHP